MRAPSSGMTTQSPLIDLTHSDNETPLAASARVLQTHSLRRSSQTQPYATSARPLHSTPKYTAVKNRSYNGKDQVQYKSPPATGIMYRTALELQNPAKRRKTRHGSLSSSSPDPLGVQQMPMTGSRTVFKHGMPFQPAYSDREIPRKSAASEKAKLQVLIRPPRAGTKINPRLSSSRSTSEEENRPFVYRHYSSSPTTSFSNYAADSPGSQLLEEARASAVLEAKGKPVWKGGGGGGGGKWIYPDGTEAHKQGLARKKVLKSDSISTPTELQRRNPKLVRRSHQTKPDPQPYRPFHHSLSGRRTKQNTFRSLESKDSHFTNPFVSVQQESSGSNISLVRKVQPAPSFSDNIQLPYMSFFDREAVKKGFAHDNLSLREQKMLANKIFHVDFSFDELEEVYRTIVLLQKRSIEEFLGMSLSDKIMLAMKSKTSSIYEICHYIKTSKHQKRSGRRILEARSDKAIRAFLEDSKQQQLASEPQIQRISSKASVPLISTLLRERESSGLAPVRVGQGRQPFVVESSTFLEDSIVPQSEWTDCSGDISALSWAGEDTYICGATAHSDAHNMQYNKPGNLGVGSCSLDTLKSISDHRIARPVIESSDNAENSLDAMRRTQDPWLYTSVVSTSYSEISKFAFTASFDRTVKVWTVDKKGTSMDLCGTWQHDGNVNFVVGTNCHDRVATASDVSDNAIRVYSLNYNDVASSPYDTYSGDRAQEQAIELRHNDTWAYYPATIAWGKVPSVQNFLLVGYSPRSVTGHEVDIPEEKRNSGEISLWNTEDRSRVRISSAHYMNVFEVIWHPTQPMFIAATSPSGVFEPADTKTQVRLFAQNEVGIFIHIKALDCRAMDINELTIMPNSNVQCYITASCTDGNTYVWDTAQGDRPIHTLGHGESLDNPLHDVPREIADTGVKFASWGQTSDRFYTGSSDGKVKAWDVRAPKGQAFVRTVLSVSGGISSGAFSGDFSRLVIGDATGKVHLLGIDEDSDDDSPQERAVVKTAIKPTAWLRSTIPGGKAPKVIIPHHEISPPLQTDIGVKIEQTADELARTYIEEGQIRLHPDRRIGAIQGPNYAELKLYRLEEHENNDGSMPLRPTVQARQQFEILNDPETRILRLPNMRSSNKQQHEENLKKDSQLLPKIPVSLRHEVELDYEPEYEFEFDEVVMSIKNFWVGKLKRKGRDRNRGPIDHEGEDSAMAIME
ncbi:hypothetical protein B0O99DRAFT_547507 [Bisporella sp. PMI_857]|nr:hypothetical protein B0O99DRAFT_547507 [Bisporella sp. PMI_857]